MAKTYLFEELDAATREYLIAVRETQGKGAPGVFVAASDSLPGCGCIAGPVLIVVTLLLTLTTWLDIVYKDPVRVAVLQTGGLVLGGWLLAAGFRGKGGKRTAGAWVYADALYLYEAYREQVTVTSVESVEDARYTHNYDKNGNYQNSLVEIKLGRDRASLTVTHEARAEHMVTFLNYLAWARGPDGAERADLGPADLGGLAKYVARNGDEPKDAEGNINLNLVELDITEVPAEPAREGRAAPAFLPYVFMLVGGLLCFLVMGFAINPYFRDEAIFAKVTGDPPREQPGALRAYLIDPRNRLHRDEVLARLPKFYTPAIDHVERQAENKQLGRAMGEILRNLSTAEQPVVSLRVTETQAPPSSTEKGGRENKLRTEFADGVNVAFANEPWGKQVPPPPDYTWGGPDDPPPIGHQLIAFVEAPEEKPAHFDLAYSVVPAPAPNQYQINVTVVLRADIAMDATARTTFTVPGTFTAADIDSNNVGSRVKDALVRQMIGAPANRGLGIPPQFP
ncbi:MAG: hypothetical protein ACKODX_15175 [Gemmata sp.]